MYITIIQRNMLLNIGSNAINLDISMLHVGVYFVKLDAIKYRKVIQFIKTE